MLAPMTSNASTESARPRRPPWLRSQRPCHRLVNTSIPWLLAALGTALSPAARAEESGDEFVGYWKTAQGDGIVQLQRCAIYKDAPPTALCGVVVWDSAVDNPKRTTPLDCNRKIFEATRFEAGVWKDGWAFDTRKKQFYRVKLRLKDGYMHARAYVGSEVNGQTEIFTRVAAVPPGCDGRKPEATSVVGVGQ